MTVNRRNFLKTSAAAAAASALVTGRAGALIMPPTEPLTPPPSADLRDLALKAIDAAKAAGAEYSDVRIAQNRSQFVQTRERRVQGLADTETFGMGIRALVNGAWGFVATADLSTDGVTAAARQAVVQAQGKSRRGHASDHAGALRRGAEGRMDRADQGRSVQRSDRRQGRAAPRGERSSAEGEGARFVNSGMFFLREEKTFANTEGTLRRCRRSIAAQPTMTVTAVSADNSDFQTRQSTDVAPRGLGYEHVTDSELVDERAHAGPRKRCRSSRRSRSRSGATISCCTRRTSGSRSTRSIAHPTELDRALGYEANYAGTSFVAPPEKVLGQLQYGPQLMNIQGDRTQLGSLARVRLGRRRRDARDLRHHQERHRRRLPDHARAGAVARLVVQEAGQADALARLLVLADRGPTCSSSACRTCRCSRATRTSVVRRPHRGDGSRHRDHRRRFVLDRPAALQRAVRRPAVLRDQGRQDRRHAQGRRLPDAHAGVLELAWT